MTGDGAVVDAVIEQLRVEDPALAGDAEAALDALTAGEGPAMITQARLQRFCWYTLPVKFMTDTAHHHAIASALAVALDRLGLARYATIARSETTRGVINAFGESMEAGRRAYRDADVASGLVVPATESITFGAVMGWVEAEAWESTVDMLEMAIVAGDLVPGSRGAKTRQAALVDAWLTGPDRHDGPGSWLDAIRAERLDTWHNRTPSPTRRRLIEPLLDALGEPGDPPEDAVEVLDARLGWLLGRLADGGQPLTQTGNLNRALVREAAPRFGYPDYFAAPSSEYDVYDLHQVRALLTGRRLARTSKGRLVLTVAGKTALADPGVLWGHLVRGLIPHHPFDAVCGIVTLALLVTAERVTRSELTETVTAVVTEEGWHSAGTGDPPDERTISSSWHVTTNLARSLGLTIDRDRPYDDAGLGLTPAGRQAGLDALGHVATGPRDQP